MMRGVAQEGSFSNGEYNAAQTLKELAAFDSALQERITQIEKGEVVNGHSPNGLLTEALDGKNPDSARAFVEEYQWLLAFEAFPFRSQEDKRSLMHASIDALYDAGERYDTEDTSEPNFLVHASDVISAYLREVFGEPASQVVPPEIAKRLFVPFVLQPGAEGTSTSIVPPPQDVSVVEESRISPEAELPKKIAEAETLTEPEPTLPNERTAEDLHEGQTVLVLWNSQLVESKIQKVVPYTHPFENKVAPLPEEKLQVLQEAQQRRKALLATHYPYDKPMTKRNAIPSGINSNGVEMTRSEFVHAQIMPDPELLRLAIAMQPAFSQFIPRKSPGFVRVAIPGESGLIIDMNVNRVIPMDAWQRIREDSDYRIKWYASGTSKDQQYHDELAAAMTQRILNETVQPDLTREEGQTRRARTRGKNKNHIALEAVAQYGS